MPESAPAGGIDIHQHLWPTELIEELRRRARPPFLRGWTLHTSYEPPYPICPADHDVERRRSQESGRDTVLISLSTPIGIERLDPADAAPLLRAWHEGLTRFGAPFRGWAAVTEIDPDLDELKRQLTDDPAIAGLQVSATALATPAALERLAPVLAVAEGAGRPVLVHPGPVEPVAATPAWWAPVVQYPAQLQSAWWAWFEAGRKLLPQLRICFVAGAGLAPSGHERFRARSGETFVVDPNVFVDTSSYGRQGVDSLARALGIDTIVLGSDRPYAEPVDPMLGDAAAYAIQSANPTRLLKGSAA